MTPAARYAAAIDVLEAWHQGQPAEQALTRWARGARYAGSKDRAAVRDHVYDVIRLKRTVGALGGGDGGRAWILGLLRHTGIAPETVFTGEGHAPAALTQAEAQSAGSAAGVVDIPDWTVPLFEARFGPNTAEVLARMQTRAPLYLRVNHRRTTPDTVMPALAADGVVAHPVAQAEGALVVEDGARRLRQSAAYQSGLVEIQDLSVQMAVAAVPWPNGGQILDYCAGGGGKSLAVADRSEARLFAHDANPKRMTDLDPRADRAGVRIATLSSGALGDHAPYDAVLCDVPCSGSGTWRRDPEAKWRLQPSDLATLAETQDTILAEAAPLVRPGGVLIHMTCSVFADENEARVAQFLRTHSDWRLEADLFFSPLDASDGFYAAWMRAPDETP